MPPQPPTSLKIEDLRARLRADAKSRHFYPLAEELRKIGKLDEAEQILHTGLTAHPTYLSAWISLGRVLLDAGKKREAADAFLRALVVDPGNVVAARLAADNYLELGEKVEAIKKYKLVHALMPSDEAVEEIIDTLDRELNPLKFAAESVPPAQPSLAQAPGARRDLTAEYEVLPPVAEGVSEAIAGSNAASSETAPREGADSGPVPVPASDFGDDPFGLSDNTVAPEETVGAVADVSADEVAAIPSEEQLGEIYTVAGVNGGASDAVDVDGSGGGMSVFETPLQSPESDQHFDPIAAASTAHEPADSMAGSPLGVAAAESVWEPAEEQGEEEPSTAEPPVATLTIGDLYARQGHPEAAREVYTKVAEREPDNVIAAERLRSLTSDPKSGKTERLQRWLEKVGRRGTAGI